MSLIRYTPRTSLHPVFADFDRVFGRFFGDSGALAQAEPTERSWTPAVDVVEQDDKFVLTADLPDVDQKDIEVKIDDGTLTIKAERKFESDVSKDNYRRIERNYGSFARSFSLPETVNAEGIDAKYDKGVLRLTLPKVEVEQEKARVISVS